MEKVKVWCNHQYGKYYLHPRCNLTKVLADLSKRESLSVKNLKALADIGYQTEYTGDRCPPLDAMGAIYIKE